MKNIQTRLDRIKRVVSLLTGEDESKIRVLRDYRGKFFLYCGSLRSHRKFWSYIAEQLGFYKDEYEYENLLRKHNGVHECETSPVFDTVEDLLDFMEEVLLKISLK